MEATSTLKMKNFENDLILKVLNGEPAERTPIWIMRQAGRFLPEYRAVRAKYNFVTMCKTPELSAKITIQPVDVLGVDAAIIFSDILFLPEAMGMHLVIEEGKGGPHFSNPIRNRNSLAMIHDIDCSTNLKFVADAIRIAVNSLKGRVPLIGFSGSPWTILAYMVEGKGGDFSHARAMLYEEPSFSHRLLEMLTKNIIDYLRMQCEAGASVVQIFDTWGGILQPQLYEEFSLRYIKEIVQSLRGLTPVIVFSKGANLSLASISNIGAAAIGIDWTIQIEDAARKVDTVLQGNLDPAILLTNPSVIISKASQVMEMAPVNKHIFNLGHGIMPNTPVDNVKTLVNFVKNFKPSKQNNG
jgi:uroporphyrinogen decarboxylase